MKWRLPRVAPRQAFTNRTGNTLVGIVVAMVAFGTVMVASASVGANTGSSTFGLMSIDIIYVILGFGVLWLVARTPFVLNPRFGWTAIAVGLGLLVVVSRFGVSVGGGDRWIKLGPATFQPSEFFKMATVLYVAGVLSLKRDVVGNWQRLVLWLSPVLLGAAMILKEHDLGTSSVVLAILFSMLIVGGIEGRYLLIGGIGALVLGGVAIRFSGYARARVESFLSPQAHSQQGGYQVIQSLIGFGAGGVKGLGYGNSREKWGLLPNPHTDFIFSVLGEELGLIGTLVVVALFVAFLACGARIVMECSSDSHRIVAAGIVTWITFEAAVNMASVLDLWPVTGIPLPFFSYGGSALVIDLAAVGLLLRLANIETPVDTLVVRDTLGNIWPRHRYAAPEVLTRRPAPAPRASAPSAHQRQDYWR